jgi:Holliday junction resolvase
MTNYERGVYFEKRVMNHLESEGYFCLDRRGSHGPIDVAAIKVNQILGIQCKTDGALSPLDWNNLRLVCTTFGMVPILAERAFGKIVLWELYGERIPYDRQPPKRLFVTDQAAA